MSPPDRTVAQVQKLNILEQVIASSIGGTIAALVVTPLDVVKTRLQAQRKKIKATLSKSEKKYRYKNTLDAFFKIGRHEGVRGFWRGFGPGLLMTVLSTTLYITLYENSKYFLETTTYNLLWAPAISGAFARAVSVLCISPLDLFRTNLQSHSKKIASHQLFANIWRSGNLSTFWIGVRPTLWRDVPFSVIYWTIFECIKRNHSHPGFLDNFIAGGVSGSIAALATIPFDVIKTRAQMDVHKMNEHVTPSSKPQSVLGLMREVIEKEGFRTLFRGILPRVAKVAPASAIMISTYEYLKGLFYKQRLKLSNTTNHAMSSHKTSSCSYPVTMATPRRE
ncbi:mitochondrial substrate carrier family protein H-like [Schistocerca gregaria]|uniref:mitochondrial substrate carrier family protein H-like n=1 Tax=Schistocerca gregaria TaxID=7010 RepID=UPI00211DB479|nr:mitochondrial substrate carrier family protein H-like [Schistocerca gregaria]